MSKVHRSPELSLINLKSLCHRAENLGKERPGNQHYVESTNVTVDPTPSGGKEQSSN